MAIPPNDLQKFVSSRKLPSRRHVKLSVCVYFCVYTQKEGKFLDELDFPVGFVEVGSLFDGTINLNIPSCGRATLVEHGGVRHINPSPGCPSDVLRQIHEAHHEKLQQLAKRYRTSVEDLKRKNGVVLPELHNCQVGTLHFGWARLTEMVQPGAIDSRPAWIIQAEKALTKYPYSLLFSFLRLVEEQSGKSMLDSWVPVEKALGWCTSFGLPSVDEEFCPDCGNYCLRLEAFQGEVLIFYLLFCLWKALFEWEVFAKYWQPLESPESKDDEGYRHKIHRYATILLGFRQRPSGSLFASDTNLEHAMSQEHWLRQQIQRTPHLRKAYEEAQANVGFFAKSYTSDIVNQRCRAKQKYLFEVRKQITQAHSVFDLCYLQLSQLMLKPADMWVRHLRCCEVASCGRIFWAPHGHQKYCEDHPKGAVWAANNPEKRGRPPKGRGEKQ
jgi:uncharacterized protein YeaO (DUF488 family)